MNAEERYLRTKGMSDRDKFMATLCMTQPRNTIKLTDQALMSMVPGGVFVMWRDEASLEYRLEYRPPGVDT